MVEEFANGYAALLKNSTLLPETKAIYADIEDMLARLDEFETLLANVKVEIGGVIHKDLPDILFFRAHFNDLVKKVDDLETYVHAMTESVDEMERMTTLAEETLNPKEYGFKNLFKPLMPK